MLILLALWIPECLAGAVLVDATSTDGWAVPIVENTFKLVVDRGKRDGIIDSGARDLRVYRHDGEVVEVGTGRVESIAGSTTTVVVTVAAGDAPKIGDHVVLVTDNPTPAAPSVGWELAVHGIEIRDHRGRILNDWAQYRKDPDAIPDALFCAAVAADVRATGAAMLDPSLDVPIPAGRYQGQRPSDVLRATTADDACNALQYLFELVPEALAQDDESPSSLVYAWATNGGPMSEPELRARAEAMDEVALQGLVAAHGGDHPYAVKWFELARLAQESGDLDEARALATLLERFAAVTGDADDRAFALRARSIVLAADGDAEAATSRLVDAIALQPIGEAYMRADIAAIQWGAGDPRAGDTFDAAIAAGDIGARWERYGDWLVSESRFTEARDAYEKAIAFHSARPTEARSRLRLGWCRMGLANAWMYGGSTDVALIFWEQAMSHAEAHGPPLLLSLCKHGKARALQLSGEVAASIPLYDEASDELNIAGRPDLAALVIRDGVRALTMLGRVRTASYWLDWAIEQLRGRGLDADLAQTLMERGLLEVRIGDTAAGLAIYEEAGRLFGESDEKYAYSVWLATGAALADLGRDDEAEAAYDRAVATATASGERKSVLFARLRRAVFLEDEAELLAVLGDSWQEDGSAEVVTAKLELAELHRKQGRLDEALEEAQYARKLTLLDDSFAEASALLLLGEIAADRGQLDDAAKLLDEVYTRFQALHEPYAIHEVFLAYKSVLLLQTGGAGSTDFYADQLAWVAGNDLLRDGACKVETLVALHRIRQGDLAEAERLGHTARRHAEQVDDRLWEARASLVLAEIASLRGEPEATVAYARRAGDLLRSMREPDPAARIEALQWEALGQLGVDPAAAAGLADEALALEPRLPVDRTLAHIVRARLEPDRGIPILQAALAATGRIDPTRRDAARRDLIGLQLAAGDVTAAESVGFEREQPEDAIAFALNQLALADIHDARGDDEAAQRLRRAADRLPRMLERRAAVVGSTTYRDGLLALEQRFPDLQLRSALAPEALEAQLGDLRPGEALVMPVVLADRTFLFVARGGDTAPSWVEVEVDQIRVDALVDQLRARLQTPADPWEPSRGVRVRTTDAGDPAAPSRELHTLLVAPLAPHLDGVDTLVFAPAGRLRYVPFAALFDGEQYLVERYAVAVLTPSGSTTQHRPIDKSRPLLALSNPDGSLPGATTEVAAIARTWGRKRVLTHDGAAATESQLRTDLSKAGILHLATHGFLLEEAPRDSYLLFAGDGADARLTVREITLLDLDKIDLAVLSACQTAVGDAGEGREIAGLAYQLEVRGAAAIVASLWAVNDQSTSELMSGMYAHLAKGDATRSGALREAQLGLLADERLRHPYYWAPFILIGDWR